MVLILTLNPMLEYRLQYAALLHGSVNRSPVQSVGAGGKGINVSRQLLRLGLTSLNYTFTGGNNGKMFRELVVADGLQVTAVKTESETRVGFVVSAIGISECTSFFGADTVLTFGEIAAFTGKLEKMIANCEVLVLSGSSPHPLADTIFPLAIKIGAAMDKLTVLDTYGTHLNACIEQAPVFLHNNCDELSRTLGIPLISEEQKLRCAADLHKRGIKQVCLTDGGNPTIASAFGYSYRVTPPTVAVIDPTGSGDSFVAGMVFGMVNDFSFQDSLRLGSALGAVNAGMFATANASPDEAALLVPGIQVEPIGVKLNELNVPRVL